jgi:hypothetical protein
LLFLEPSNNLLDREELAVPHARARRVLLGSIPGPFTFNDLRPKRPSAALGRSHFVETTDGLSRNFFPVEEDTIESVHGVDLIQRPVPVNHPGVPNQKLGVLHADMGCHRKAFVIIKPNRAFAAGAAISATGALELEAFLKPRRRAI